MTIATAAVRDQSPSPPGVKAPVRPSVNRWRAATAAICLIAAFVAAYYSTIEKLVAYWNSNETYSYGFLVPLIVGYLIWAKRDVLQMTPPAPSYGLGGATLTVGLAMLIIGRISATNVVEELSLPVTITGIVLMVLGWRMTRALAFPLIYLLAMIPFWGFLLEPLQPPFQLYSAVVGVGALRLFDVPVLRDGIFIYLPDATLEVADVCSGINQLLAILCIGVPLAQLNISRWWRRAVIIAASLLIALLSNGLRVAMISLFAYYGIRGPNGDIHGPYSLLRTTLISGVGFLILFWLIFRFSDTAPAPSRARTEFPPFYPSRISVLAVAVATMFLGATIAFEQWHRVTPVQLSTDFQSFPSTIGRWQLVPRQSLSSAARDQTFDVSLTRRYAAADGGHMELMLGFFPDQHQGRELVGVEVAQILSPRVGETRRPLKSGRQVNEYVTTVGQDRYYVVYCYVVGDRLVSSAYEAKFWSTWNALVRRRSDGGIIVLRAPLGGARTREEVRANTEDFVDGVLSASLRHFPG